MNLRDYNSKYSALVINETAANEVDCEPVLKTRNMFQACQRIMPVVAVAAGTAAGAGVAERLCVTRRSNCSRQRGHKPTELQVRGLGAGFL